MVASINLFEIIKTKNNASEIKGGNLTALMYVKNEKPVLAVWKGKQRKPFHHYSHRSLESMYQAWEELKRSDEAKL